jgi:hypothetical protein
MPSWLTTLVAGIAVYWIAIEAQAERARRNGELTLYRAPLGLRVLFGLTLPAMVYGAGAVALSQNFRQDWWVSALLLGIAIFCASQWPSDLGVSDAGIYEQKWFGLRKRSFRWEEIASAMVSPSDDSVSVVSKSGVTIKHSRYHVDRAGFILQVKNYCIWVG